MAGGDRIAPLVIFSVLFLALTLAVISQMVDVFYANAENQKNPNLNTGYAMIGGHQYSMWTSLPGAGTSNQTVNGTKVNEWSQWEPNGVYSTGPNFDLRTHLSFYDPSADPPNHHRLDVYIVRNNTDYYNYPGNLGSSDPRVQSTAMRDFFYFREYAYSGAIWDAHNVWYDVVSFAQIQSASMKVAENQNMSAFSVLGKYNVTFFAGPTPGSGLNQSYAMSINHFSIQVGSDLVNMMTRGHIGMWNIVGDLFLFKSEELGMPDWLNMFISTILWICVGFAVVAIISRFIPMIGGL